MPDGDPLPEEQQRKIETLFRERFASSDEQVDGLTSILTARKNVILYGPPGTGKTYAALNVAAAWREANGNDSVFSVTFHPSYSYEDFVEGYRPVRGKPGIYDLRDGVLLEACTEAEKRLKVARETKAAETRVLVLVDEINRGDVARILGESITYLEADKRGVEFSLAQSPTEKQTIPANLFLLGTMNTADKSISLIDVALRRRFAFVEFRPESGSFAAVPNWAEEVAGVPVGAVLDGLNDRLRRESIDPDRSVGQALLSVRAGATDPLGELRNRFRFDIQPLIEEYCYSDRSRARRILGDYVDASGRAVNLTDEEFVRLLETLAAEAPGWNLGKTVPDGGAAEPGEVAADADLDEGASAADVEAGATPDSVGEVIIESDAG